jgi:hypothetical protein
MNLVLLALEFLAGPNAYRGYIKVFNFIRSVVVASIGAIDTITVSNRNVFNRFNFNVSRFIYLIYVPTVQRMENVLYDRQYRRNDVVVDVDLLQFQGARACVHDARSMTS